MNGHVFSLDMFSCDDSTVWFVQLSDPGGQDVFVHEEDRRRVQCSDLWCLQQGWTERWVDEGNERGECFCLGGVPWHMGTP